MKRTPHYVFVNFIKLFLHHSRKCCPNSVYKAHREGTYSCCFYHSHTTDSYVNSCWLGSNMCRCWRSRIPHYPGLICSGSIEFKQAIVILKTANTLCPYLDFIDGIELDPGNLDRSFSWKCFSSLHF